MKSQNPPFPAGLLMELTQLVELDLVLPTDERVVEDEDVMRFTCVSVQVKFAEPDNNAGLPGSVAFPSKSRAG
jgi:hypothetical protein